MPTPISRKSPETTGAVLVTRDAPPGLPRRAAAIRTQGADLLIVDNGSRTAAAREELRELEGAGIPVLRWPDNRGIAAALNRGIDALVERHCGQFWLFDHDSEPAADCLRHLLAAAADPWGLRVPVPIGRGGRPARWPQTPVGRRWTLTLQGIPDDLTPFPVDFAISSGSLLDAAAWRAAGRFDEGLFVDLVDTEYCLRLRDHGGTVRVVPRARLHHQVGAPERRRLAGLREVYPSFHAPSRHYTMARNRVLVARRHGRRFPSWLSFEAVAAAKLLVKSLLFEPRRLRRLAWTLRGTWDGLRGRSGPPPG